LARLAQNLNLTRPVGLVDPLNQVRSPESGAGFCAVIWTSAASKAAAGWSSRLQTGRFEIGDGEPS